MPLSNRIAKYTKEIDTHAYLLADQVGVGRSTLNRLSKSPVDFPRKDVLESLCDKEYKHPVHFITYTYPDGTNIDDHLRIVSDCLSLSPGNAGLDRAIAYLKSQKTD
jgi:DNA-binding Xre family transcriptional regulator